MGVHIIGAGNNVSAKVNDLGLLQTESVGIGTPHYVNLEYESAYVVSFQVNPDPESNFFYMRNDSETPLVVETMTVFSDSTSEAVCIYTNPTGTPTGGNSVIPVNSNLGSNKKATGFFEYGSNLTGLSGGDFYGRGYFRSGVLIEYIFRNWIVMPRNASLMLCAENGESELTVSIPFFYIIG